MKPLTTAETELFVNFNFHSSIKLYEIEFFILYNIIVYVFKCMLYNIIHSFCISALNKVHDKHKINTNTNNSDWTVFYTVCFLSACLGLPIT